MFDGKNKKNFLRAIVCSALFILILLSCEKILFVDGSCWGVWKNVSENKNVEILFLGTSQSYTSVDNAVLSEMFNKNISVLGVPGTRMPLIYEALKIVLKYQKPKIVIIDALSLFSNFNEIDNKALGHTLEMYDGIPNYFYKGSAFAALVSPAHIPLGLFQLFRQNYMWRRWNEIGKTKKKYDRFNGHRSVYGNHLWRKLYKTDKSLEEMIKSAPDRNEDYFETNFKVFVEAAELCKQNGIEVWVFKIPDMWGNGAEQEKVIEKVSHLNYVKYIDNFYGIEKIRTLKLTIQDYGDAGHLNRSGVMKLTNYYAELIQKRTGWTIKNGIFAYNGESIEQIGKNIYRYTMENMQKGVLYKFVLLDGKNKVLKTQDFSEQNYFDCEVNILEKPQYNVKAIMLPTDIKSIDHKTIKEEALELSFMKY
ncbi:MAG: hypothetical protein LBH29_00235 [Elusimicrobiota bacterium]|jgi:hypothetical protein|nr:hypothetical protein [Elusimicrobiota bacterium]